MIIRADLADASVSLMDPTAFTAFHVAVAGGPVDDPGLGALLAPYGRLDGDHAWITTDGVSRLAGDAADADWHAGFSAMVDFARNSGFLSDDGTAIRAHIEPA